MSGSKVLPSRESAPESILEEKFRVENDRRLIGCTGAGALLATPFVAWALTVQIILDPFVLPPETPRRPDRGIVVVPPPAGYHRSIKEQRAEKRRVARHHAKPGDAGRKAPVAKTRHPAEKPGWLGQNLVTSLSKHRGLGAYDILGASLKHVDLNKLDELPILRRTSQSHIAGRRGRVSHEFNVEYGEQGDCAAHCDPGALPGLPPLPGITAIGSRPTPVSGPRISSIEYADAANARSSASILAVIRSHAPGLRHAYNGYLKRLPGLSGKINLRFSIAPSGDVVELSVVSSTTGASDFDAEIARLVKAWRFDPVGAPGNDHVTVPLSFSE